MPNASDPREIAELEREQALDSQNQKSRDAAQLATPAGRRWAYELTAALFVVLPPGSSEAALRENEGRRRLAADVYARIAAHPDVLILCMSEQADRKRADDDLRAARAHQSDTRRQRQRADDGDYAP